MKEKSAELICSPSSSLDAKAANIAIQDKLQFFKSVFPYKYDLLKSNFLLQSGTEVWLVCMVQYHLIKPTYA